MCCIVFEAMNTRFAFGRSTSFVSLMYLASGRRTCVVCLRLIGVGGGRPRGRTRFVVAWMPLEGLIRRLRERRDQVFFSWNDLVFLIAVNCRGFLVRD